MLGSLTNNYKLAYFHVIRILIICIIIIIICIIISICALVRKDPDWG